MVASLVLFYKVASLCILVLWNCGFLIGGLVLADVVFCLAWMISSVRLLAWWFAGLFGGLGIWILVCFGFWGWCDMV